MADEYTPTTTEVREVVMGAADRWTMTHRERGEALDRFLAAHEASIRERIAEEILAREPEIRGYVDFEQHRDSCIGEINGLRRAALIVKNTEP